MISFAVYSQTTSINIHSHVEAARQHLLKGSENKIDLAKTELQRAMQLDAKSTTSYLLLGDSQCSEKQMLNIEQETLVQLLIALKADVNIQGENGVTPLMIAAAQGNKRIAKLLLNAGANKKIQSIEKNFTAEDFAKTCGHKTLATFIKKYKRAKSCCSGQ